MKKSMVKYWLMVILFITLYSLIWLTESLGLLSFIVFIPLLVLQDERPRLYSVYLFSALIIGNLVIFNSVLNYSVTGGISIAIYTTIFQVVPFLLRSLTDHRLHKNLLFISAFLLCELLQLNMEFSAPLLITGYSLGSLNSFIQWYEITGVEGGTLWICSVNVVLYHFISSFKSRPTKKTVVYVSGLFLLPLSASFLLYHETPSYTTLNATMVHTASDCFTDKVLIPADQLVDEYISITPYDNLQNTDILIWPETAITDLGWMSYLTQGDVFSHVVNSLSSFKDLILITGAIIYEDSPGKETGSNYSEQLSQYFRAYNSSVLFDFGSNKVEVRTKGRRVPFEENKPQNLVYKYLAKLYDGIAGYGINRNSDLEKNLFEVNNHSMLGLICWEVLYGNYLNKFSDDGFNAIIVHMNEGWLDDLKASTHFRKIMQVRAIEQRKQILVSSNLGTSSVIDSRGLIVTSKQGGEKGFIQATLGLNNKRTVYSMFDFMIPSIAIIVLIFSITTVIANKRQASY